MKKILALSFSFFALLSVCAQNQNPIKWTASYNSISSLEGEIIIRAAIEKTWHTYSQQANNAVPFPTLFSFKESKQYQLVGKTMENNAHEEFDAALGEKLLVFTDKAEFKQKVKLLTSGPQTILFKAEYICCDNKMCLPPTTIDLTVKVQ
jgi:thiol:disulfide interchange protein DsbD